MVLARTIIWGLIVVGAVGFWGAVASFTGLLGQMAPRLIGAGQLQERFGKTKAGSAQTWPLIARIAKSFSRLSTKHKNDEQLWDKLVRAGLPYRTPSHYYSNIFAYTILFGAAGVFAGILLTLVTQLPPWIVLIMGFVSGFWGTTQPDDDLKKHLKDRERNLIVDMTFSMPRLLLILEAQGEPQNALLKYLSMTPETEVSAEKVQKLKEAAANESAEYANLISQSLTGFGGNLFAEVLNRLSAQLSQGIAPKEATHYVQRFYPRVPELGNFMDIMVAGIKGEIPVKERLHDLTNTLQKDMQLRQKEAGENAKQIIDLASVAQLLPIFLVVMAPLVFFAVQFFA